MANTLSSTATIIHFSSTPKPTPVEPTIDTFKPTFKTSSQGNVLYISVGVSGSVILLIVAVIIITTVTICLKKRVNRKLLNTADNVAYGTNQVMELSDNVGYTTTTTVDKINETENYDDTYEYIATADNNNDIIISATPNEAYGMSINRLNGVVQS